MTERLINNYGDDRVFYRRLETLACLLNCHAIEAGAKSLYWVDDTYLDYGQNWMWTTILRDSNYGAVQVLSPRDWKVLMDLTRDGADAVMTAYDLVTNDKYFTA